ncbi:MAG: AAA family ATPase [Thermoplasmatota archaeon]
MLIKSLEVENFKVFHGVNRIQMAEGPGNVVVVQGDNGRGKSTLMEAVFWALYGKEKRHDRLVAPNYPGIINNTAKKEGSNRARVSVAFEHDGRLIEVERRVEAKRGVAEPSRRSDFEETLSFRVDGRDLGSDNSLLYDIFPEDVASFFFFDGETISRYAEAQANNRETVEKALGLPFLRQAREDIERVRRDIEKDLKDVQSSPEAEKTEAELKELRARAAQQVAELNEEEVGLEALNRDIRSLQHNLEEFDDLRGIQARIQELEEFAAELEKEEAGIVGAEAAFKAELPWLILGKSVRGAVEFVGKIKEQAVEERIEQGRLMDQIEFMRDLKAGGVCICGGRLEADALAHIDEMLGRLNQALGTIKVIETDRFSWTQGDLTTAMSKARAVEDETQNIHSLEAKRRYLDDNRARVARALERERESLRNHSAQNLREKEVFDRLTQLTKEKAVCQARLEETRGALNLTRRQVTELERQLEISMSRKSAATKSLIEAISHAGRVLRALEEIIDRSAEQRRAEIERRASSIYTSITNKPLEFIGLSIDPETFEVRVRAEGGELIESKKLSDGERHVLALSFLGGLKDSTHEGTLIMDSPFGRLDQTHKTRLIQKIPELAKNVMLLVTDEDLRPEDWKTLSGVQRRFLLDHDQTQKFSTVQEVR